MTSAFAEIIPSDRLINWGAYVGIPGGIPVRTAIFVNVKDAPYGAVGNGVVDDWNAIQRAINDCPANKVVYIPAGTYRIGNTIRMKEYVTVRGAGIGKTILSFPNALPSAVSFERGTAIVQDQDISSGYVRGSTKITVPDTSLMKPGMHVIIDQLNDSTVVNPYGLEGPGASSNRDYARAVGQICEITAVEGKTVSFTPPLIWNYKQSLQPKAFLTTASGNTMIKYAGLENLSLYNTGGQVRKTIYFVRAAYCWVKDCEAYRGLNRQIEMHWSYRCEIRGSLFRDTASTAPGANSAYCVALATKSCFNLVEDNISTGNLNMAILEASPMGNVIAYNFSTNNVYYSKEWMGADYVTHLLHPSYNLFEGNVGNLFQADFIHGSSSHNVLFRNHFRGKSPTTLIHHRAIVLDSWCRHFSAVGNVLGNSTWTSKDLYERAGVFYSPHSEPVIWRLGYRGAFSDLGGFDHEVKRTLYRHGNYDAVTRSVIWDSTNSDKNLPASLYLSGKPSWWGNLAWPPIGPDRSPMVGMIPAEVRFRGLGNTERPSPPVNLRVISVSQN